MQEVGDNIYFVVFAGMGGVFLLVIAFIFLYISNQNKFLKQNQQLQETEINHQKNLLHAIIQSQEEERKRIGQDLHDDVGAALSSLRLTLDMYKPAISETDDYNLFCANCKKAIDDVINDVRHISHNLSPVIISFQGLTAALEKQLSVINKSGAMEAVIINQADEVISKLSLPVATALYRVMEELLNNTIKHSGAEKIEIQFLLEDHFLIIEYRDNGKGLPKELTDLKKGMGMQNIESRVNMINASYQIDSELEKGFFIQIKYPLSS